MHTHFGYAHSASRGVPVSDPCLRQTCSAESSSSCSSLRVSSLLQSYQEHDGEGTRARLLCASCGTIGRPKRAFGSLLIAAHPQSTVPSPAARTRRDNTSRAQVPGVDDARLPGLLLHRRLRTRRPAAVPCGGRTCAGQNNCLPNHRRGLSRARSPAGSRERRVALGSSAPPSAAALPHLWVLASGLARRAASGGARPFAAPPPAKSLIARTPLAGGQPGLQAAGGAQTLARRGDSLGQEGGGWR